jgi:hypothetical protein
MDETEFSHKKCRAVDATFILEGEAVSTSTPFYWSWYRLVFTEQNPGQHDEHHPAPDAQKAGTDSVSGQ